MDRETEKQSQADIQIVREREKLAAKLIETDRQAPRHTHTHTHTHT